MDAGSNQVDLVERAPAIDAPARDSKPHSPPEVQRPAPATPIDYVKPAELVTDMLNAASVKAGLSVRDMLIRGFLSGVFLAFATALAFTVVGQGLPPIAGAIIFPAGFVLLVLLGLELATGNFALLPAGMAAGRVTLRRLLRNWTWVYLANLIGCLFFALLFYATTTQLGTAEAGGIGGALAGTAEAKTVAYKSLGAAGWILAFIKGILANWMVTVGAVMLFVSRSALGKAALMWLPIMIFFALGYEHSIVNMFVVPVGIMFGAEVTVGDWWLWNQIPVTLGNILAGALFTGLALYYTHGPKKVVTVTA